MEQGKRGRGRPKGTIKPDSSHQLKLMERDRRASLTTFQRMMERIQVVDECWILGKGSLDVYSTVTVDGVTHQGHNWFWTEVNGPLPAGKILDHLCEVKRCVRLSHLEPKTGAENLKAWYARRRIC